MSTVEKKCWPAQFDAVEDGSKPFEWRREDDVRYEVGDVFVGRRWDPSTGDYTGKTFARTITYVLRDRFGMPPGFVVLGFGRTPAAAAVLEVPNDPPVTQASPETREMLQMLTAKWPAEVRERVQAARDAGDWRPPWRVGRKLGRTLYLNNVCVGMIDTAELAAEIVASMNPHPPTPSPEPPPAPRCGTCGGTGLVLPLDQLDRIGPKTHVACPDCSAPP